MNYPSKNSLNNVLAPLLFKLNESDQKVFASLFNQDVSENTKQAWASDLKRFLEWYERVNGERFSFGRFTQRDVIDFKKYSQITQNYKPATINRRLMSIRALCKVAIELGLLQESPMKGVKQVASQSLAPKGLDPVELRKLLKEVEIRGNLRDKLIVEMLCNSGLRVSELVGLTVQDVHLSERKGYVTIRSGKGNKYRIVPLKTEIRELMKAYLEKSKPTNQIFMGQRGSLKSIAINNIIEKYSKKAGFRCNPHALRHTFAYNYLKHHNSDIVGLAQILGHSNIQTTSIYVQHNLETLMEKMEHINY